MKWMFLALLCLAPMVSSADIHYVLSIEPAAQSVRVKITLDEGADKEEFRIPLWCPGFYQVQNYQTKISNVNATDSTGKALTISHKDDRGWVVDNPQKGSVVFTYRVLGDDPALGFFGDSVGPETAFVSGPATYMYVQNRLAEHVDVTLNAPPKWDVATSLDRSTSGYVADGYDELIDNPIQMGSFVKRTFLIEETPFQVVFVPSGGKINCDVNSETSRIRTLFQPTVKMFEDMPFKQYTVFLHLAVGTFDGGLEHRAGTVIALPNSEKLQLNDLVSHEFIHAWNVKQIRPKALGPFDYANKVRTGNLWFAEGVTDYYSKIHSYRSGLFDEPWLLNEMNDQIHELQSGKTRLSKTLEQSSRECWESDGFGVGDLSFYNKGQLVGLILDAAIREASSGRKCLDDVMRLMFKKYRLPHAGYDEDGILKAVNQVAGADLSELYKKMVSSTAELPYDKLAAIGLRVRMPGDNAASLGFTNENYVVTSVAQEQSEHGLKVGDTFSSVDDQPWTESSFESLKNAKTFKVKVNRDGEEVELTLEVLHTPAKAYQLEKDPFATVAQRERLSQFLVRNLEEDGGSKQSRRYAARAPQPR